MIEFVRGTVHSRDIQRLVVDIGALGLGIDVPASVALTAAPIGGRVELHTHLLVREDALQLVGFATDTQKRMFLALTSVSGIGPKVALKILSDIEPGDLASAIVRGDVVRLTKLPGIGKKTAEVLVAHLKDAMGKSSGRKSIPLSEIPSGSTSTGSSPTAPSPWTAAAQDAILALQALGLDGLRAENAVRRALEESGAETDVSKLVGLALRRV